MLLARFGAWTMSACVLACFIEGPGPAPPPPAPSPPRKASPPAPAPPPNGKSRGPDIGGPDVISGRVVLRNGGELIEGLVIDYPEDLPHGERRRMTADVGKNGTFAIGGFKVGRSHDLIVRAFSYVEIGRVENVAAGTRDLIIPVEPGGTIRGKVLDAAGNSVGAGVEVSARLSREPDLLYCGTVCPGENSSTKTAEDGTFLLEWLANWDFTVTARRGSDRDGEADSAIWIPPGSMGLVLRLGPGPWVPEWEGERREPSSHVPAPTAISGRLVHPAGEAFLHWMWVELLPEGGGEARRARVSPSGLFDSGRIASGNYTLRARTGSLPVAEAKSVKSGARGLEIPLDALGSISGQVFDSGGRPVENGVMVVAESAETEGAKRTGGWSEATTREDGTFTVYFLGEGEFTVHARPSANSVRRGMTDQAGWAAKGVSPGAKGLALRLEAPVTLRGRVDWSGSAPRPESLKVCARQPDRAGVHGWARDAYADPKGTFTLTDLAAGKARITLIVDKKEFDLGEFEVPAKDLVLKIPESELPR